jgi:hypothetical protein
MLLKVQDIQIAKGNSNDTEGEKVGHFFTTRKKLIYLYYFCKILKYILSNSDQELT